MINLTDRQQAVVDHPLKAGELVAVTSLAGTGKTTTLQYLAGRVQSRVLYLVYTKQAQLDAERKFGRNVECRTINSLCWKDFGSKYREKLGRLTPACTKIVLQRHMDQFPEAAQSRSVLWTYAALSRKAVNLFTFSRAKKMTIHHVPPAWGLQTIDGDTRVKIKELAELVWTAMCDTSDEQIKMTHDGYLKLYQLSGKSPKHSVVLLDECQPTGTKVLTPQGARSIQDLRIGDRVVSYSEKGGYMNLSGNKILGITKRTVRENLVVVKAGELQSRYTGNHICLALAGNAFLNKYTVYVMSKGNSFRVGVTRDYHGRKRSSTGPSGRLYEERGEKLWALAVFDSRAEALMEESFVSTEFGLPQTVFRSSGNSIPQLVLDKFWERKGDLTVKAKRCLVAYGRDLRYPLTEKCWKGQKKDFHRSLNLMVRLSRIRACNLMTGMDVISGELAMAFRVYNRKLKKQDCVYVPIEVTRSRYSGQVYSMDVERNHTYVADGIITHNCQDSNPATLGILENVRGAAVMIGDPHQQIYAFRGSRNAFELLKSNHHYILNQSFRFGQAIADEALEVLHRYKAETCAYLGMGTAFEEQHGHTVARLSRTNVDIIKRANRMVDDKAAFHIAGGLPADLFSDCYDVLNIGNHDWFFKNPFFGMFDTKADFKAYADQGRERHLVSLYTFAITHSGAMRDMQRRIEAANQPAAPGTRVLSTAHKSKGLEWDHVTLSDDFQFSFSADGTLGEDEANLLYVAITRAKGSMQIPSDLRQLIRAGKPEHKD